MFEATMDSISPKKSKEQELLDKLASDRAQRRHLLELENKIMNTRLVRLNLLKQHYLDHWLGMDLKEYESKYDALYNRLRFVTYQTGLNRVEGLERHVSKESLALDQEITKLESQVRKLKSLDPKLVAEYRKLKDDLECQKLLIEYSECAIDK